MAVIDRVHLNISRLVYEKLLAHKKQLGLSWSEFLVGLLEDAIQLDAIQKGQQITNG